MKQKKFLLKIWLFVILYVLLAFILLFSIIPITYNVNKKIQGIMWDRDDVSFSEHVEITMKGKIKKYLFNFIYEDSYTGSFCISNIELTKSYSLYTITNFNQKNGIISLLYFNQYESVPLGILRQSHNFSEGVIYLSNYVSENKELLISFPCKNRPEALSLANDKFPEFKCFH